MKLIVLTNDAEIYQRLKIFSPETHFVIAENIISLHNGIVKEDFDGILIDCTKSPVWHMDIEEHVKMSRFNNRCFYFNSETLSQMYIELYSIEKSKKYEPIISSLKSFEKLLQGSQADKNSEPLFISNRLNNHQKELLNYFCTNEGKLLSFKDMSEHLFGTFNEKHKKTIYAYIHSIRSCIEENPRLPKHLIRKEKGMYTYI